MPLNEHVLRSSIRELIVEISIRNAKIKFKKDFLGKHADYREMSPRGQGEKEVRIRHVDTTWTSTEKEIRDRLEDVGYTIEDTIQPGAPGSKSKKYATYMIRSEDGPLVPLVFGSATRGTQFETMLHNELAAGLNTDLTAGFLEALGISATDVLEVKPQGPPRKRPLTGNISDVGEIISDITLVVKDSSGGKKNLYISLKDPTGATFANLGYAGAFVKNNDGTFSAQPHRSDKFIEALGVNKEKLAQGLSDYALDKNSTEDLCQTEFVENFDTETIAQYLGSALGYGYTYARQLLGDKWHVMKIDSAETVKEIIGKPISASIRYARNCHTGNYPSSKSTRVLLKMDNGAKYSISIRNSSGKIRPTEIKIRILSYPDKKVNEAFSRDMLRHLIIDEARQFMPAQDSPRTIALRLLEEHGLEPAMNIAARDGNFAVLKILMDFGPDSASDVRHFPFGRM